MTQLFLCFFYLLAGQPSCGQSQIAVLRWDHALQKMT